VIQVGSRASEPHPWLCFHLLSRGYAADAYGMSDGSFCVEYEVRVGRIRSGAGCMASDAWQRCCRTGDCLHVLVCKGCIRPREIDGEARVWHQVSGLVPCGALLRALGDLTTCSVPWARAVQSTMPNPVVHEAGDNWVASDSGMRSGHGATGCACCRGKPWAIVAQSQLRQKNGVVLEVRDGPQRGLLAVSPGDSITASFDVENPSKTVAVGGVTVVAGALHASAWAPCFPRLLSSPHPARAVCSPCAAGVLLPPSRVTVYFCSCCAEVYAHLVLKVRRSSWTGSVCLGSAVRRLGKLAPEAKVRLCACVPVRVTVSVYVWERGVRYCRVISPLSRRVFPCR
jgi:hypothetical protein